MNQNRNMSAIPGGVSARVTLRRPVDATIHELSPATHVVSPLIGAIFNAMVTEWKWIGAREMEHPTKMAMPPFSLFEFNMFDRSITLWLFNIAMV